MNGQMWPGDSALTSTLQSHRELLPALNRKPVAGSKDRVLLYDAAADLANWEGEDILPGSPIPEVED